MAAEFDPRRAEPDQEFSYTTYAEKVVDADEIPEGATVLGVEPDDDGPRRVRVRIEGIQRTLKADGDGVVHPKTADDETILKSFGLPVAQKAKAAERAEKEPTAVKPEASAKEK